MHFWQNMVLHKRLFHFCWCIKVHGTKPPGSAIQLTTPITTGSITTKSREVSGQHLGWYFTMTYPANQYPANFCHTVRKHK
uniref:Secreted protein n=1 Tax=Pyxicephalus adspersus TaxID=30357 RepID=A0AAV2ZXD1_PYXAD|nr:TPA: hypothetical protein GDO54_002767 [Pyxicephalus adspersus]